MRWTFALVFAVGCANTATSNSADCESLCKTLTVQCKYDAYPTEESCLQGCAWSVQQKADVAGMDACVTAAVTNGNCDTFAVVECQHEYGAQGSP